MKLADYRETYYECSGTASTVARQLMLGGIALIWIFKIEGGANAFALPRGLLIPGGALIIALALDLLQYYSKAVIWGLFHRYKENKRQNISDNPEIEAHYTLNWPANVLFHGKILVTLFAYFHLLKHVINAVSFQ